MDFFLKARTVRLISHNNRFLITDKDCITISHGCDRSAKNAVWIVELVKGKDSIRLKSCYGTYLTASGTPVIPGVTGKRVVQTLACQSDSATEWEPSRDGMQVRLRSFHGHFLRPNCGLTPWRNAVTHDVPHRSKTREKMLWDVEVVEKLSSDQRIMQSQLQSRSLDLNRQQDDAGRLVLDERDDDDDDDDDEGVYNNIKCCWLPKACLLF